MNEEITDVKPPKGFAHITDLVGSEATILQVANSQGDILGYATLDDIDAYIQNKVAQTIHSFTQKQTFQDVTINGTFDGNNVINTDKLNSALGNYSKKITKTEYSQSATTTTLDISSLLTNSSQGRYGLYIEVCAWGDRYFTGFIMGNKSSWKIFAITQNSVNISVNNNSVLTVEFPYPPYNYWINVHTL